MDGSDNASSCAVRRGRRPHGTPRNFMHENRETSEMPAENVSRRSAGEGSGHTARVYVSEESHRCIVPMNHSNKDRKSSAESEEGRLRIKENTLSSDTYPTQSGTARVPRVGECADKRHVWPLYLREEPDALKSARPGLCGGRSVMVVPTAIANNQSLWGD
jgi:hypothetical protein